MSSSPPTSGSQEPLKINNITSTEFKCFRPPMSVILCVQREMKMNQPVHSRSHACQTRCTVLCLCCAVVCWPRRAASDDVAALKTTVLEIQSLVGDCETDTQATPRHPRRLRMLLADKTAQPCAAAALTYMDEGIGQLERLVGGNLKAGLVQGELCCASGFGPMSLSWLS